MSWSLDNIDWNGTGAMVQAIGSVAAIFAAITIDHRASARLRRDRELTASAAVKARVAGLEWCQRALDAAEREVQAIELGTQRIGRLSDRCWRSLRGATKAIKHYLRHGADTPPDLVAALILSHQVMARFITLMSGPPISGTSGRDFALEQAAMARRNLDAILSEYREGVL